METTNKKALQTVLEYFNAWSNKDFEKATSLLSDDIVFEMPINSYGNRNEFMQAVQFTGTAASNINLLVKLGDDHEAILVYDFTLQSVGNLRIAEHFKVKEDKIVFVRHIHDTYELRKAGFDKSKS